MATSTTLYESLDQDLILLSQESQDYMVAIRRYLHMYPELSWGEANTIAFIKKEIQKLLLTHKGSYLLSEKEGGLVLDINVSSEFDRILFRADIDALPIQEETNLPFSSKIPNVMHACGHDFHVAMLLGALKTIITHPLEIKHNLRFIFQRAEESPMHGSGGESLVKDGILNHISKVYCLHITSRDKLGLFRSKPGVMLANCASVSFVIKSMGGHVMCPEKGSNAIDIITDIHNHLRGFALRCIGPKESICFIPTVSRAGNVCNIMPGYAHTTYAFRNYLKEKERNEFLTSLEKRIRAIVQTYPDSSLHSFEVSSGYPILENDPSSYVYVDKLLKKVCFETGYADQVFAGDDFTYYLQKAKGAYWTLGAGKENYYDHHTSLFNPDEEALSKGAAFWLLLATND